MTGNRVNTYRHAHHRPSWTMKNTADPHNITALLPGVTIMRRTGPASRPRPLRGSTYGRVLTPAPYRRLSAPMPGTGQSGHKQPGRRGLTAPLLSGMTERGMAVHGHEHAPARAHAFEVAADHGRDTERPSHLDEVGGFTATLGHQPRRSH